MTLIVGRVRLLAVMASVAALCMAFAGSASAHSWNLEAEVPASAEGVTAPANPFADHYGNGGVWTLGYGGRSGYTGGVFGGLTTFEAGAAGEWSEAAGGAPGAEVWSRGFPFIGINHTESTVGLWPAGSVFMHPAPDNIEEVTRPGAAWVSPITGTVKLEATFTKLDCGGGDGTDFSVDHRAAGTATFTHLADGAIGVFCGSGSYDSGTVNVVAGETYYFTVGDGMNGDYTFDTTGLSVKISDGVSDPLTISVPKEASVVYRHAIAPITVSGKDSDGDPVTLGATNIPAGLSFSAATGELSGTVTAPAGRYAVTFSANDGHGEAVTTQWALTIEKGNCAIVNKAAFLTSAAKPAVSVKLYEAGTKFGLANKEVLFSAYPISGGEIGLAAKTTSTGVAKPKWVAAQPNIYNVYTQFNGDGFYNSCASVTPEIVTLYPTSYTTTGGGLITVGKKLTAFGLLAVQGETGQSGGVLMSTPEGTLLATNMAAATITKPTATSATVTGPGGWNGQEAEYSLTTSDPGTGADTLSVTVSVAGTTVWSSNGPQTVKGDAKVH